jgi:hypothetical protein
MTPKNMTETKMTDRRMTTCLIDTPACSTGLLRVEKTMKVKKEVNAAAHTAPSSASFLLGIVITKELVLIICVVD